MVCFILFQVVFRFILHALFLFTPTIHCIFLFIYCTPYFIYSLYINVLNGMVFKRILQNESASVAVFESAAWQTTASQLHNSAVWFWTTYGKRELGFSGAARAGFDERPNAYHGLYVNSSRAQDTEYRNIPFEQRVSVNNEDESAHISAAHKE